MAFVFINNFSTTLAAAASSTATQLTLASSAGLPTLASGDTLALTLNDAATNSVYEILYVTAINGAVITCTRGNEGTSATAWSAGDLCKGNLTAGELENIIPSTYVETFNTRSGAVTLSATDVNGALGYTAANAANVVNTFNGRLGAVTLSATDVDDALGYTAANDAHVVHLAGTETITGTKTFDATVTMASTAIALPDGFAIGEGAAGTGFGVINQNTPEWVFTILANNTASFSSTLTASTFVATTPGNGFSMPSGWNIAEGPSADTWGIINTNAPAWALYFDTSENATFGGAITCATMNATGSDRRLKRNIRKAEPRPLHRAIPYVSFERKADGSHGRGAIAQAVQKFEPAYVGTFTVGGKERLSLDYQSMAYEQAIWAGRELDRQAKRIAKLERALAHARIKPRKRGCVRRLLEAIW